MAVGAAAVAYVGAKVIGGISKLIGGRKKRRALRQARNLQRANTVENFLRERRRFQRAGRAAIADASIAAASSQEGQGALQGSVFQATQASLQTQLGSRLGEFDDQELRNRKIELLGQKADRIQQQTNQITTVTDTASDILGIFV